MDFIFDPEDDESRSPEEIRKELMEAGINVDECLRKAKTMIDEAIRKHDQEKQTP